MRKSLAALTLSGILGIGCDSGRGPGSQPEAVLLTLRAFPPSGEPGKPVTLTAFALNQRATPILHFDGCLFVNGITFEAFASDGTAVYLAHVYPPLCSPLCPDVGAVLEAGDGLLAELSFDGRLVSAACWPYDAPSDTYTIRVHFGWNTGLTGDDWVEETAQTTLRWRARGGGE